jgi:hypothetical protein
MSTEQSIRQSKARSDFRHLNRVAVEYYKKRRRDNTVIAELTVGLLLLLRPPPL